MLKAASLLIVKCANVSSSVGTKIIKKGPSLILRMANGSSVIVNN
jgi:hypothetical protein